MRKAKKRKAIFKKLLWGRGWRIIRSLFNFKVKTSHISSVVYEEDIVLVKIISVKQHGMNIVTQAKIQSQQSTFINFLNTNLTGKFLEESRTKKNL